MPTTLANPAISISAKATLTSGSPPAPVGASLNHVPNFSLAAGNSAGNVDRCYAATFAVTAGTPLTINLATALDPLGNPMGIVHVTAVLVENDSTTAGQDFTVGGGTHAVLGSDQFTAQANGGAAMIANPNPGYAVTVGSADTLTVSVASGAAVPGKITVLGRSA